MLLLFLHLLSDQSFNLAQPPFSNNLKTYIVTQHAKKIVADSQGLADFAVGLVDSVLHLPDGQMKFFGKIFEEIQIAVLL